MTVVQAATLFTADNTLHYIFFSIISIITTHIDKYILSQILNLMILLPVALHSFLL